MKKFPSFKTQLQSTPKTFRSTSHCHYRPFASVKTTQARSSASQSCIRRFSQHMVELGIYQPSTSPVSCPLHIKKKILNGDHGDYRRLKTVTPPDGYPVLYIQNFSMHLHGCKIFSKIDLIRAHHFIPVALEDVHKTDITTPFGLFDFE